ncbi:Ribonuclease H-like domain,HAT, C-terminal dimerisation domain [Cinara cedri]|uniref:Ribonuclease H-like domain,HAT, C-terminal dimerisation domain n=1 Tax=Cinara cedri TaxID=506608 RepID=A0A5E4MDJ7_9HEMI|nr:Ribonuclease H-like domain,HAT, C-terminal dimerisation domain [Cinara cedri]
MAKLASRILAIPASERSFSTSGRVIEERTRLKGDTVDSLLFLDDFYKKKM